MITRLLLVLALVVGLASCSAEEPAETEGACDYRTEGQVASVEVSPPPADPAVSGEIDVTLSTNIGDLDITLDAEHAPCTVGSFLSLAEQGYYDELTCHRMTVEGAGIYVLQCGDPTGTGAGGPGYVFDDELSGEESYGPGTLAMANAGVTADGGTNGSQFFIVYAESMLQAHYTVFGRVDEAGVDLVRQVAAEGVEGGGVDGTPVSPVRIEGVSRD